MRVGVFWVLRQDAVIVGFIIERRVLIGCLRDGFVFVSISVFARRGVGVGLVERCGSFWVFVRGGREFGNFGFQGEDVWGVNFRGGGIVAREGFMGGLWFVLVGVVLVVVVGWVGVLLGMMGDCVGVVAGVGGCCSVFTPLFDWRGFCFGDCYPTFVSLFSEFC
uniref:Transmembrane protein n=1 Tax=Kalanchoe fedtschenkoi TaxID=63787 RepID=A0A7N0V8S7_KALFE